MPFIIRLENVETINFFGKNMKENFRQYSLPNSNDDGQKLISTNSNSYFVSLVWNFLLA